MDSLTKRPLSGDELALLVRRAFGDQAEMVDWSELPEGNYNAAYLVTLAGRERDLVLKVAPDPRLHLLTYEVDLMRTEVDFYRRAHLAGVPVPRVAFADFSRRAVETDYVFLDRLNGVPLKRARDGMSPSQLATVRAELGGIAGHLHTVTGASFGYPLRASPTWQPTWRAAFGAMVDDLVADTRRLGAELPESPERISALMHAHDNVLDQVFRPALVHFDLWDGNVFVDRTPDGCWRVTGLIDGERAFFGDPVAELVSLALYRDPADVPGLLAGYAAGSADAVGWLSRGSDGAVELTDGGRRRLSLYTVYLYLIMGIEGVTRGFETPEHEEFRRRVLDLLEVQLGELARAGPSGRR